MSDRSFDDFERMKQGGGKIKWILLAMIGGAAAVYFAFIRLPGHIELSNMVPGMNPAMTQLECWVTIEFKDRPAIENLHDVKIVFDSEALVREQTFDWSFIARNDFFAQGRPEPNPNTNPASAPPIGEPLKVRFPLRARSRVEDGHMNLPLTAAIYWGGAKQDTLQRNVAHVYRPDY